MFRHLLNLSTAYVAANKRFFIGGLIIGIFLVIAWLRFLPWWENRPHRQVIGLVGDFTVATLPTPIQNQLSLGLTQASADGEILPSAAVSWEATDSDKSFIFRLRPNLYWQDGRKFSAFDVNYNLEDVRIFPLDSERVRFDLKSPFAPLPSVLSQPLFRPGLIGLGRYHTISIRSSGRFLQSILIGSGREEILYKFYPTAERAKIALKLGEIRQLVDDQATSGEPDFSRLAVIILNLKNGLTEEKSFREGLAYALPEDFPGLRSYGPIPPNSWAYNPNLKKYRQDIKLSRSLLAKSVGSGSAGLTLSATSDLLPAAQSVADSWRAVGINTRVEISDTVPKDFDAYLLFIPIPIDPDQYSLWHSISIVNISGYKSPKADKLLEEGRQILDPKIRRQKYTDFQKAITEDLPAIFLFFPKKSLIDRHNL